MKKRILAVLIIICMTVLPLTACGETLGRVKVTGKQDYSYAVFSNGGSTVQYGNYVYFINGYRGYDDEDANSNKFGKVVKGALYRAELNGSSVTKTIETYYGEKQYKAFVPASVAETELDFLSTKETFVDGYEKDENGEFIKDEDGNYIETTHEDDVINVQVIAPKTIGSSGYSDGGIFIYDNFVYYASPSNLKNKSGEVEVNKNIFYRTKLDGSLTEKIYSSSHETNDSAYSFYKQGDSVYLTVLDGTDVVSVRMTEKKISKKLIIAQDVEDVYFPEREVYFDGIGTNGAEDFVYITRAIDENDTVRSGKVIEIMRPSGEERIELIKNGKDVAVMGVDNGYLFYKIDGDVSDEIRYTNLHDALTTIDPDTNEAFSPSYAAAPQNVAEENGIVLSVESMSDFSEVHCFRPNVKSNQTYALCVTGSKVTIYCNNQGKVIYTDSASVLKIDSSKNIVYFNSSSNLYSMNLYDGSGLMSYTSTMSLNVTYTFDTFGEYIVYYTSVDDYAADYAVVHKLGDAENKFIGKKINDDIYDPSVELEEGAEEEEEDE